MTLPNLPEGYSYGYLFNEATGRQLDLYGSWMGMPRKKWIMFKEPDFLYHRRLVLTAIEKMKEITA